MKLLHLLIIVCALSTSACATIVSDNKSFVQIESQPSEIVCLLEGENYKQEVITPANIIIPAKASPVLISCTKDGYFLTAQEIIAKMNGATFGNILFGGVIGVAVDAVTKSGYKYPKTVELYLYKKHFKSQEEKDVYYQQKLEELYAEIKTQKTILKDEMDDEKLDDKKSNNSQKYARALKKIDAYYETQLALINKNKELAEIVEKKDKVEK